MKYFGDFTLGDEQLFQGGHHVTGEKIIEVGVKWDPQPFHTDPELAKASHFGGLVASSVHLFGISVRLSSVVSEGQRTAEVSALGFDKTKLILPVKAGDTMRLKSRVLGARVSNSKPQLGIITLTSDLINQNEATVYIIFLRFILSSLVHFKVAQC